MAVEDPAHEQQQRQEDKRLTDEDFKSLIDTLQPHEELEKLRQIELSIRDTQARRQRESEEMKAKIQGMETALQELKRNSTRAAAEWRSLNSHREVMAKLDNQKFDLAKNINEEESKLSALQSELSELKREYEEVDAMDVENEYDLDRDALCLKLFRGLGFLPSKDATLSAADNFSSILVRSDKRNAALPFEVSDDKLKQLGISPLILADQLWKAAD